MHEELTDLFGIISTKFENMQQSVSTLKEDLSALQNTSNVAEDSSLLEYAQKDMAPDLLLADAVEEYEHEFTVPTICAR